ncbi:helix-turn-helix domain-containing protein [Rhizobiaceae bacterium n13]|uniref:helix-turn-helix domain-containing protein n=1 Tax=Ferirhizobium litorale TaxID=2927786 RepID=UPI0024B317AE|nr:helix-turn-helix domain-containing protein [Fererhizobium litorale]MDI7862840.1 helix-turn-helix domain-containing protein [Fererhizobium litorale]
MTGSRRDRRRRNLQNARLARTNWLYRPEDVVELYGICRNTLTNWVKTGLVRLEHEGRHLFRGDDLNAFHRQRREDAKRPCEFYEVHCFACKCKHSLLQVNFETQLTRFGDVRLAIECPDRGKPTAKRVTREQLERIVAMRESSPKTKTPD